MVGLKYNTKTPVDSQMKTFYILIKSIAAFHVNMWQQLHLTENSIICDSGVLFYLLTDLTLQSTTDILTRSSLPSFLSILAQFSEPNL